MQPKGFLHEILILAENVYVMFCKIWYHLYKLKNGKNTHGGVLLLVKFQAKSLYICTNGTKSRNTTQYENADMEFCFLFHCIFTKSSEISLSENDSKIKTEN